MALKEKSVGQVYSEGMFALFSRYVNKYRDDPNYFKMIISLSVPKIVLLEYYNKMVNNKTIIPIEDLLPQEKQELANEVGKHDDLKNICKALYVIKKCL